MTALMAFFVAGASFFIAVMFLAIRWTTKGYARVLIVALALPVLALGYGSMAGLLGLPKPVSLEWFKSEAKKARVLGYFLVDGKTIDLWIVVEGDMEPTYYSLPWSTKDAQQLQDAAAKARREHTGVEVDWQALKKGEGLAQRLKDALLGKGKPGGLPYAHSEETRPGPKFYALPQPKMPDKQVPAPGFEYHRPGASH